MSQIINTNINSLIAQNNLNKSQSSLQTSLTRLSSGLRINSAADDAAGLAISSRFTTQINGLDTASRNANDGISLAQTTGGALDEVTNNLQRIRELAVQSANGTNSASDRSALDAEVQQRLQEIDRTASQTSFNGLNVLDGSYGTSQFQVGANAGQTISVTLSQGVRIGQIGQIASQSNTVAAGATSGSDTFQVGTGPITTISASSNYAGTAPGQTSDSAYAKAAAVTAASVPGLTATAANSQGYAAAGVVAANAYTLVVNGTTVVNKAAAATALTTQNIVDSVNSNSSTTGVTAALQGANIIFNTTDGRNITLNQTFTAGDGLGAGATGTLNGVTYASGGALTTATDTIDRGTVSFSANDSITYAGGTAASATSLGFSGQNVAIAKDNTTLASLNVKTIAGANDAIKRIDSALSTVSAVQANLGAIQNRFTSAIATIQSTSQNLTASRSRIQDADFAGETANLSRANILQQAGISVLSQANSAPQSVLSLLK